MLILRTAQGGGGDSSGRRHGHGGVGAKKEWYVGGTVQRAVREVELAELGVGVGPNCGVDGRWF